MAEVTIVPYEKGTGVRMSEIIEKPFDWNDNLSEIAQEDFAMMQQNLSYGTATIIGLALAKLELLEKQGCKVEPNTGHWEQYGEPWEDKFKCSKCGKGQPKILCCGQIVGYWSDYCPNCGTKMGKGKE